MRLAEGFRLAGAPDHLDESADYHIASTATLYEKMNSPTPMTVPGVPRSPPKNWCDCWRPSHWC